MKLTAISFIMFITSSGFAQHAIKTLNATDIQALDFSPEGEKKFNETPSEEIEMGYWDTEPAGCSWYCGGGPRAVTASSSLKGQGENSYEAGNAHDFSYKTAWVEGVPGYGIGQFLEYEFDGASPRINTIIIANGYVKSKATWENNSRVKKFKVYLNNNPLYILNLEDKRATHRFNVEPIGHGDRLNLEAMEKLPSWKLKFEILEVYKGLKYDDVAISEIFFDGLDVHCLTKGTKVSMSNGQLKNIEDVIEGDEVLTYMENIHELKASRVEATAKAIHHHLVKYSFDNGAEIIATKDHPLLVNKKGWSSTHPEGSQQYNGFHSTKLIQLGDEVQFMTPERGMLTARVVRIEQIPGHYETYTITRISEGNNFIANGIVVGTEEVIMMSTNR